MCGVEKTHSELCCLFLRGDSHGSGRFKSFGKELQGEHNYRCVLESWAGSWIQELTNRPAKRRQGTGRNVVMPESDWHMVFIFLKKQAPHPARLREQRFARCVLTLLHTEQQAKRYIRRYCNPLSFLKAIIYTTESIFVLTCRLLHFSLSHSMYVVWFNETRADLS